jgi:hypothetical protein
VLLTPVFAATLLFDLATVGVDFAAAFFAGAATLFGVAFATGFAETFVAADLLGEDLATDVLAADVFEEEMALVSLGLVDFASDFEGVEPAKRLESKPLRFLPAFASVEPFANFYLSPPPLNRIYGDSGITKTHVKFLFSKKQDWVFYKHSPETYPNRDNLALNCGTGLVDINFRHGLFIPAMKIIG